MPVHSSEDTLCIAAFDGDYYLAETLIKQGVNIDEVNAEGYTALLVAAKQGYEELVSLLLFHGADIDFLSATQETALGLACGGGSIETADFLVKSGANIELGAKTPLMLAATEGHVELVRYLIDNDCNLSAKTANGDTALSFAREKGHDEIVELLTQALEAPPRSRPVHRGLRLFQ